MRWNLSGLAEPEATWVMSGLPSALAGPRAATAADGADHEVDGDDVDGALRHAGELA